MLKRLKTRWYKKIEYSRKKIWAGVSVIVIKLVRDSVGAVIYFLQVNAIPHLSLWRTSFKDWYQYRHSRWHSRRQTKIYFSPLKDSTWNIKMIPCTPPNHQIISWMKIRDKNDAWMLICISPKEIHFTLNMGTLVHGKVPNSSTCKFFLTFLSFFFYVFLPCPKHTHS